jgi:GTPase SAR1 family protein
MENNHFREVDPKKRHKEIENYMEKEKVRYIQMMSEPKLLLLGTSDSGKSTLLKQFRILYGNGFTDEEKSKYFKAILKNIASAVNTLLTYLRY